MDSIRIGTSSEGNLGVHLPGCITSVGIENITELVSHEITREAGAVAHLIRFQGGGYFRLLYTEAGELKECSGHHVMVAFAPGNRVVLQRYPE